MMKKNDFLMVIAVVAFFAFGTTAIAAEKASQNFNQQRGHASQTEVQKGQHQAMNKAETKNQDWGKAATKGNDQAKENSLQKIELETARQMFQGKMRDPFVGME